MSLVALGIGGQVAHEFAVAILVRRVVVIGEVHGGIVDAGSLMQINVDTLVGTQLQGRLHGGGSGRCLGRIGGNSLFHPPAYLTQAACLPFIFLCVIVSGYPPGSVVGSHAEFGLLLLYNKVYKVLALGKLIAESQSIVEHAETHHQTSLAAGLVQPHGHLVVMIADFRLFAPHGLPGLVERGMVHARHLESRTEIRHVGILSPQQESQMAVGHHCRPLEGEVVGGAALGIQAEFGFQHPIGRSEGLCRNCAGSHGQKDCKQVLFHIVFPCFSVSPQNSSIMMPRGSSCIMSSISTSFPVSTSWAFLVGITS